MCCKGMLKSLQNVACIQDAEQAGALRSVLGMGMKEYTYGNVAEHCQAG